MQHPHIEIQIEATKALESFCSAYFNSKSPVNTNPETLKWIVLAVQNLFKSSQTDDNVAVTRGYNMAFGALSDDILKELNVELLDTLRANCLAKGKESDDAETRK